MTNEEKKARKKELLGAIGGDFAVIQAAEQGVKDLEVALAPKVAELIKVTGSPGPHPMRTPDGTKMIANFRKDGKVFKITAVPASTLDEE